MLLMVLHIWFEPIFPIDLGDIALGIFLTICTLGFFVGGIIILRDGIKLAGK
jgi:hypothetical protein